MRGYDDSNGSHWRTAGYERSAAVGRRGLLLPCSGRTVSLATGRLLRLMSRVMRQGLSRNSFPATLAVRLSLAAECHLMRESSDNTRLGRAAHGHSLPRTMRTTIFPGTSSPHTSLALNNKRPACGMESLTVVQGNAQRSRAIEWT